MIGLCTPFPRPARLLLALLAAAALAIPAVAQQAESSDAAARVDRLVEEARLQEAAWLALEAGDTARSRRITARLDSILRSAPRSARPLSMDSQGVSYTWRLDYGNGVHALFKVDGTDIFCRACGSEREVAAFRVDRLLGFQLTPHTVPHTIVVEDDTLAGSAMYFVRGARSPRDAGIDKPDRLRFFDAVLGNSDRHAGNWLILEGGRVVAIDHNRAFEYRPKTRPKTCWETEVDSLIAPGALGEPLRRYSALPAESLAATIDDLVEPELVRMFVAMRPRIVKRIEARAAQPGRDLGLTDCRFGQP